MKRKWNGIAITGLAIMLAFASPIAVFADGEFETKNYQVDVKVHEDQSYDVSETIDVNFPKEKHGIYRYIPYCGSYRTVVDGKKVVESYIAKIKDIDVKNDKYDVSDGDSNKVIQIGDEDKVITGKHTYDISYCYTMENDSDNGRDVFYLNVIPTGWESSIDQASIKIHMPKKFDQANVEVFAGEYGDKQEGLVEYQVSGKDILITSSKELSKGTGVTVRAELPEEYFTGVASTKGFAYAGVFLGLLCSIGFVLVWLRFGRERKFVKTIEFYPPDKMSPAELGYIVDGSVDRQDMLSLIIYFASKGYLKIEKKETGETYLIREKKTISGMPEFQRIFFNGLFKHANKSSGAQKVAISMISEGFYEQYESATVSLESRFFGEKSIYEKSGTLLITDIILAVLMVGGALLFSLASGDVSNIILYIFPAIAYIFAYVVCRKLIVGRYIDSMAKKIRNRVIIILVVCIAIGIELGTLGLSVTVISPPYFLYALASVLGFFAVCHSERRSQYGAEILGKTLGFRDFILKAEKDRINMLVEENPQYFYDILPYAYAMGVTKKWAKQFEGIQIDPPDWYYDNQTYSYTDLQFQYALLNEMNNISHSVSVQIDKDAPVSSDYDSDGGFSGGGAGGGGGGAW